jgi:predicted DsbA family dithiol-disulfide isomerase
VYNAAVWLRTAERELDEPLAIRWRSFPLEQVNSEDEEWRFWEQPLDGAKSLRAFLAAEAVRDQGEDVFGEFLLALLRAVHEEKQPVQAADTINEAAVRVPGLDVDRMTRDMERPELRDRIAEDYRAGVEELGVFGTPTLRFGDGDPVFVKTTLPPEEQARPLFDSVRQLSTEQPFAREFKKPRKPEGR